MIQNRIVTVACNILEFRINHTVNGQPYELKDGEYYQVVVSEDGEPGSIAWKFISYSPDCSVPLGVSAGTYYMEICLVKNGQFQVILPAADERHKPLNQLIVFERVSFA